VNAGRFDAFSRKDVQQVDQMFSIILYKLGIVVFLTKKKLFEVKTQDNLSKYVPQSETTAKLIVQHVFEPLFALRFDRRQELFASFVRQRFEVLRLVDQKLIARTDFLEACVVVLVARMEHKAIRVRRIYDVDR
jgi:hypothetical protein